MRQLPLACVEDFKQKRCHLFASPAAAGQRSYRCAAFCRCQRRFSMRRRQPRRHRPAARHAVFLMPRRFHCRCRLPERHTPAVIVSSIVSGFFSCFSQT